MSEVETIASYISREDAFFYSLVFDPHQKTLQVRAKRVHVYTVHITGFAAG